MAGRAFAPNTQSTGILPQQDIIAALRVGGGCFPRLASHDTFLCLAAGGYLILENSEHRWVNAEHSFQRKPPKVAQ